MQYKVVWQTGRLAFPIQLWQAAPDQFKVVYGLQVDAGLDYADAASKLGECIMHALALANRLDNRTPAEADADRERIEEEAGPAL